MSVDTAFTGFASDDYLYKLDDGGIVLNTEATPNAPFVDIGRVVGLDSAPARSHEREYYGADGGFVDAENESIRPIVLSGTVYSNNALDLEAYLDSLKANWALSGKVRNFYVMTPGVGTRVLFCKSLGVSYDWERGRRVGVVPIQFILRAEDPAQYGAEVVTPGVELPTGSPTGRGYNKSYNYGYGGSGVTSSVLSFTLGGNRPSYGKFLIHGPVENPTILNERTGQLMRFNTLIEPGSFYEVDLRYRRVRLNGESSRRTTLVGANIWFPFEVGLNMFTFGGTQYVAGPPNATLQALYRPAYR